MMFPPELTTLVLLTALRVGGLLLIAPMFSARVVPVKLRTALLVLVTIVLTPGAMAASQAPAITPATVMAEALTGFVIGFGAAVLIGAAETAGDIIAVQTGLSSANTLDPFTSYGSPTVGQFMGLFVTTLVLVGGGHLVMIDALAASFELIPSGTPLEWEAGIATMVRAGTTLLALGLQFAAPILAAALIGNIALGALARAAPQMNMLAVAFPLQIGVGLIVLAAVLPFIATFFLSWSDHYSALVGDYLRAFGAY